jgi:hypothetical protein
MIKNMSSIGNTDYMAFVNCGLQALRDREREREREDT